MVFLDLAHLKVDVQRYKCVAHLSKCNFYILAGKSLFEMLFLLFG
jgi:hypothetical protein